MAHQIFALAWAVALGGVAQLALQWWGLYKLGRLPRFRVDFRHPGVRRILKQMTPALLGVSVAQISLLLNTAIASALVTGAITWISNADRLMEFPTGMLGVALGTILLPSLSKAAKTDEAHFSGLLDWGLRLVLLLALPGAVGLALLSVPLVSSLYHYGRYTAADVFFTQYAVLGYSVGLAGLILVKVLAPGFYARQDMRTPVRFAIITLVLTQLFNLLFVNILPKDMAHAGLALSISLGACINAGLLWRGLIRRGAYRPQAGWGMFLGKLIVALAVMGVALWLLNPEDARWIDLRAQPLLRIGLMGGLVAAGALVYFAVLWVLGFRLKDFKRMA
jgi:putative peptidoglycan lipid II flippase